MRHMHACVAATLDRPGARTHDGKRENRDGCWHVAQPPPPLTPGPPQSRNGFFVHAALPPQAKTHGGSPLAMYLTNALAGAKSCVRPAAKFLEGGCYECRRMRDKIQQVGVTATDLLTTLEYHLTEHGGCSSDQPFLGSFHRSHVTSCTHTRVVTMTEYALSPPYHCADVT